MGLATMPVANGNWRASAPIRKAFPTVARATKPDIPSGRKVTASMDHSTQSTAFPLGALARACVFVTLAYAAAMIVTFHVLMPVQLAAFPAYESFSSLFYLPHVVRVMTAWWFGWLSVPLLLPVTILEVVHLYGRDAAATDYFAAVFTVIGPALSFSVLARLGFDARARRARRTRWPDLVAVGAFSSVVGLIGPALIYQNSLVSLAAWFLGDITGMLLVFLPVQLFFRGKSH